MPNTGVVVTQSTAEDLSLARTLPIAVVGTCSTGTLADSTPTLIESKADATTILGAGSGSDTLPNAVAVLQRYGCGKIIAMKGDSGATTPTEGVTGAIPLLGNTLSTLGIEPEIILAPTFNDATVVTALKTLCDSIHALAFISPTSATTIADVITARGTSTGVGIKDPRIVVCYPYMKNADTPTDLEELTLHLAGVLANLDNYGQSPLNQPLLGVDSPEISMTLSYSSDTSDNEKLNDNGTTTINLDPDANYVIWGGRNSDYQENETDVLTFINAVRARDKITELTRARAIKMLGQNSNYTTASLLTESYRTMLNDQISLGAIKSFTKVAINDSKTDYSQFKIYHDIEFQPWTPTEFIGASVAMTVNN